MPRGSRLFFTSPGGRGERLWYVNWFVPAYRLPRGIIRLLQKDIFNEICHQLAEVIPPTIGDGADRNGRNLDGSYCWEKGELCGQIKIITSWHAIGHPVSGICFLVLTKLTTSVERCPNSFFFFFCKRKEICCVDEGPL